MTYQSNLDTEERARLADERRELAYAYERFAPALEPCEAGEVVEAGEASCEVEVDELEPKDKAA